MRIQQIARGAEKRVAVDGKPHDARRALQQLLAQMGFQPLQLQADGRLRGVERVGGARETAQIGDQHEGPNRIEIENFHFG